MVVRTVEAKQRVSQKINLCGSGGGTSSMHALLKKKNMSQHIPVHHWRSCWRNRGVFVSTRAVPRTEVEKLMPLKKKAWESVVVILRLHPKTELLSEL